MARVTEIENNLKANHKPKLQRQKTEKKNNKQKWTQNTNKSSPKGSKEPQNLSTSVLNICQLWPHQIAFNCCNHCQRYHQLVIKILFCDLGFTKINFCGTFVIGMCEKHLQPMWSTCRHRRLINCFNHIGCSVCRLVEQTPMNS